MTVTPFAVSEAPAPLTARPVDPLPGSSGSLVPVVTVAPVRSTEPEWATTAVALDPDVEIVGVPISQSQGAIVTDPSYAASTPTDPFPCVAYEPPYSVVLPPFSESTAVELTPLVRIVESVTVAVPPPVSAVELRPPSPL